MEKASKDVILTIALQLDLSDLLSLCSTNKRFNETICRQETFWMNKIKRDFPEYYDIKFSGTKRDLYRRLYMWDSLKEKLKGNLTGYLKQLKMGDVYEVSKKRQNWNPGSVSFRSGNCNTDDNVLVVLFGVSAPGKERWALEHGLTPLFHIEESTESMYWEATVERYENNTDLKIVLISCCSDTQVRDALYWARYFDKFCFMFIGVQSEKLAYNLFTKYYPSSSRISLVGLENPFLVRNVWLMTGDEEKCVAM